MERKFQQRLPGVGWPRRTCARLDSVILFFILLEAKLKVLINIVNACAAREIEIAKRRFGRPLLVAG